MRRKRKSKGRDLRCRATCCSYECLGCGHRWRDPPMGVKLECPNTECDSLYIRWLNYDQLRREKGWP